MENMLECGLNAISLLLKSNRESLVCDCGESFCLCSYTVPVEKIVLAPVVALLCCTGPAEAASLSSSMAGANDGGAKANDTSAAAPRLFVCRVCLLHVVLTFGSCAMGTHEPCQVRKEAALSGSSHVPRGRLDRANDKGNACVQQSKKGARQ